jgi:hypothetical protein
MTIKSRPRVEVVLVVLLIPGVVGYALWSAYCLPYDEQQARQALLRSCRSHNGERSSPVQELESEPLVVRTTPEGREVWGIGNWTIDPVGRRYAYHHPDFRMLHHKHGGYFHQSRGEWHAEIDSITSVYYAPLPTPPAH